MKYLKIVKMSNSVCTICNRPIYGLNEGHADYCSFYQGD